VAPSKPQRAVQLFARRAGSVHPKPACPERVGAARTAANREVALADAPAIERRRDERPNYAFLLRREMGGPVRRVDHVAAGHHHFADRRAGLET
jgi:hypothetical protein